MASTGRSREAALSLYRALLRAHAKNLPSEMRQLGDFYVKAEFRRHKAVTQPTQLEEFFNQWNSYLDEIQRLSLARSAIAVGRTDSNPADVMDAIAIGRDLPQDIQLSEEQLAQLEKLKEEAIKAGRSTNR